MTKFDIIWLITAVIVGFSVDIILVIFCKEKRDKAKKKTLQDCTVEEMFNELQRRYDNCIVTIAVDRKIEHSGMCEKIGGYCKYMSEHGCSSSTGCVRR